MGSKPIRPHFQHLIRWLMGCASTWVFSFLFFCHLISCYSFGILSSSSHILTHSFPLHHSCGFCLCCRKISKYLAGIAEDMYFFFLAVSLIKLTIFKIKTGFSLIFFFWKIIVFPFLCSSESRCPWLTAYEERAGE